MVFMLVGKFFDISLSVLLLGCISFGAETGGAPFQHRERRPKAATPQTLRYLLSNTILTNGSYGYNYHD